MPRFVKRVSTMLDDGSRAVADRDRPADVSPGEEVQLVLLADAAAPPAAWLLSEPAWSITDLK
jgi:hypothetical protein